jgi:biotin-[acetyl-CoA-carboxylase] ligase BirA-like protein
VDPDRSTSVPERLHLDALGASNDVALRLAQQVVAEPTTVAADTLTDARCGTRQWHAPHGGLWMSALWTPEIPVEAAPRLTLAATWGVREGLRRATRVKAGYKWPNDLLVDDAKIGAVRLEGRVEAGRVRTVAIGVGVNANNPTSELPGELPATSTSVLETTGREVDLDALQEAITGGLREARGLLDEPRALNRSVAGAWTQKGAGVEVELGHAMVSGRAVGLTENGGP